MFEIECPLCGCAGIHACIGIRYIPTEEDKKRQSEQLEVLQEKLKVLTQDCHIKLC